jgi:Cd2+/Zn2+-exporting ATPase
VTAFETDARDAERLLRAIITLESRSEHPVGEAFSRWGQTYGMTPAGEVQCFISVPGQGVRGVAHGLELTVGTERLVGRSLAARWNEGEPGSTVVYADAGEAGSGKITLRDQLRPEAAATIARLHQLGVRPIVLLTGDTAAAAHPVAQLTGVDDARCRLLPSDKIDAVRELRMRYGTTGMAGDGVNDAPALAEASVGIAMGAAGSPATIETADVALMADELTKLPYAVHLARRARRIIRFNIAFALGAKLVLAVGAVMGVVSLAVAVLVGDMGGSLAVTLNALRLARIRDDH